MHAGQDGFQTLPQPPCRDRESRPDGGDRLRLCLQLNACKGFSSQMTFLKLLMCLSSRQHVSLHSFQSPVVCRGLGVGLPHPQLLSASKMMQTGLLARASKGFQLRPSGGYTLKAANWPRILLDTERRPPGQKQRSGPLQKGSGSACDLSSQHLLGLLHEMPPLGLKPPCCSRTLRRLPVGVEPSPWGAAF